MLTNYHTHTTRCGHAEGTEEEYILTALRCGFKVLGFSDHTPWAYATPGFVSRIRMLPSQLDDYVLTLRGLREKYADKLHIRIGLEAEYFPAYLGWLREEMERLDIEYLILGCHYDTTDEQDAAAVTSDTATRPLNMLARLWLDCLLAMPWNKLYRTALAKQLAFDRQYTLGEDLQFVLDYIDLLGRTAPDFAYTILTAPLTFYDCSREGTLSTKYHADYCKIWPEHFARLNKACYTAHCPQEDMRPLHRAELTVYAEGVADILRRDPAKRAAAIVKAVANFTDAKLIAELSEDLGEAMVGINADEIEIIMEERGR